MYTDTNTLCVTNVVFKDGSQNIIYQMDTMNKKNMNPKNWNGITNNGSLWDGVVSVSVLVTDINNDTSLINANTCVYACNSSNANSITNKTNCRASDMFDPVTGGFFFTSDNCLK
jgi:hypothetical protein